MIGRNYSFEFTDEEYAKYEAWCKENGLDGYHGAIGGATRLEIIPTSLGDIVTAIADVIVRDELGEPSYNAHGEIKRKRIECEIRGL